MKPETSSLPPSQFLARLGDLARHLTHGHPDPTTVPDPGGCVGRATLEIETLRARVAELTAQRDGAREALQLERERAANGRAACRAACSALGLGDGSTWAWEAIPAAAERLEAERDEARRAAGLARRLRDEADESAGRLREQLAGALKARDEAREDLAEARAAVAARRPEFEVSLSRCNSGGFGASYTEPTLYDGLRVGSVAKGDTPAAALRNLADSIEPKAEPKPARVSTRAAEDAARDAKALEAKVAELDAVRKALGHPGALFAELPGLALNLKAGADASRKAADALASHLWKVRAKLDPPGCMPFADLADAVGKLKGELQIERQRVKELAAPRGHSLSIDFDPSRAGSVVRYRHRRADLHTYAVEARGRTPGEALFSAARHLIAAEDGPPALRPESAPAAPEPVRVTFADLCKPEIRKSAPLKPPHA